MEIKGKQALADYLGCSYSYVNTNFPTVAKNALAKGIKITRQGKGENTIFLIEEVPPQETNKEEFSTRKIEVAENLPGEIWIDAFELPKHEVSNLGRVRTKKNKTLIKGTLTSDGYLASELSDGKKVRLHRIILQSFYPVENPKAYTVDHINGIRTDNRLESLRWMTNEENVFCMLAQRTDLNKELTRLIQKYSYEGTLKLLQSL